MHTNLTQVPLQSFVKLAQGNMNLLTEFMASPAAALQASPNGGQTFAESVQSTTTLMHSSAFTNMMQGMLSNYTGFLTELGQNGVSLMSHAQAALVRQTGEATAGVVKAKADHARRQPQAV